MSARDVVILSGSTTLVVMLTVWAIAGVLRDVIRPAAAVVDDVAPPPPARVAMAARVGLCSNARCARPISPDKARAGYLCPSCAGIGAPPYLPRG